MSNRRISSSTSQCGTVAICGLLGAAPDGHAGAAAGPLLRDGSRTGPPAPYSRGRRLDFETKVLKIKIRAILTAVDFVRWSRPRLCTCCGRCANAACAWRDPRARWDPPRSSTLSARFYDGSYRGSHGTKWREYLFQRRQTCTEFRRPRRGWAAPASADCRSGPRQAGIDSSKHCASQRSNAYAYIIKIGSGATKRGRGTNL